MAILPRVCRVISSEEAEEEEEEGEGILERKVKREDGEGGFARIKGERKDA